MTKLRKSYINLSFFVRYCYTQCCRNDSILCHSLLMSLAFETNDRQHQQQWFDLMFT